MGNNTVTASASEVSAEEDALNYERISDRLWRVSLAFLLYASVGILHRSVGEEPGGWGLLLSLAAALFWLGDAMWNPCAAWLRRASLGFALAAAAPAMGTNPAATLIFVCGWLALAFVSEAMRDVHRGWDQRCGRGESPGESRPPFLLDRLGAEVVLTWSVLAQVLLIAVWGISGPLEGLVTAVPLALGYAGLVYFRLRLREWQDAVIPGVFVLACLCLAAWLLVNRQFMQGLLVAVFPLLVHGSLLMLGARAARPLDALLSNPALAMVVSFVLASLGGAALLSLPGAATSTSGLDAVDSLFTATSAVCVTGLIVADTPRDFTFFGQLLILLLIQLGGLGVMTFYGAGIAMLGQRLALRHEGTFLDLAGDDNRKAIFQTVRRMLQFTLVNEVVGASLLLIAFVRLGEPWPLALWQAVFTSISAFCNAGFALRSNSLEAFQGDPLVLYTTSALIVLGGLSPMAALAIPKWYRGERLELRNAICLASTGLLLLLGALATLLFEWDASLQQLPLSGKVHNAIFHSVTLRTAGFNSFAFDQLKDETVVLMLALMVIGGSPGGTAGGVKTTTVFVLTATAWSIIRSRPAVEAFGRTIPQETVNRASAIVFVALGTILFALVTLQLVDDLPFRVAVFEVVSALGTVGLTIGGTGQLSETGKLVIILCMLLGRVGPLTVFLMWSRADAAAVARYPEERVVVG